MNHNSIQQCFKLECLVLALNGDVKGHPNYSTTNCLTKGSGGMFCKIT